MRYVSVEYRIPSIPQTLQTANKQYSYPPLVVKTVVMTDKNRTTAQQRADRIHNFQEELIALEKNGVLHLSDEQQAGINNYYQNELQDLASRYDIDQSQKEKQLSVGMKAASFLGALALAASVFFLFYQLWGHLFLWAQIGILIMAPLISLGVCTWIANHDVSGYYVKLAALVSFSCFVLNIFMYGQIFNITPSDKAFLVWAAFAFLLAYALDMRLLLVAGIACLTAFLSARMGTWSGMYWIHFGERPENFLPVSALLMLLPQYVSHGRYAGFDLVYRVSAMLIFFIPVLILANYGVISYINMDPDRIEVFYQLTGFSFSAAAIWLGIRREWPHVMNTGTVFFVIFLYTKFFDWWWDYMPKYLFFFVLGLTALLLLMIFKRLRREAIDKNLGVGL